MKIAAAYIRVSTDRQDEYSPDSQLKLIRDYASRNEMIVPDEYVFYDDGISAKSAEKRTQFNRMIALAKEKNPPFSAILVWKFSRFARNQEESILYKNLLKKNGLQVVSISEPIIDSVFGSLIERIIEWMDEFYLINLSTEVKRGMAEKASRGEAMVHPAYGYKIVEGKYYPHETESKFIKAIFEKFVKGVPIRHIVDFCNSNGCRTHRGNPFDNRMISYILTNPVYIGKIRWSMDGRAYYARRAPEKQGDNVIIVDGIHEPIVSQELFDKAQERVELNRRIYKKHQRSDIKADWMLKGLMRCECGATLTMTSTECPSMQCHEYARGGRCKTSHSLSIAKANRIVTETLEICVKEQNFTIIPHEQSINDDINYDELIKREEYKIDRCRELFINGVDTIENFKRNKEKIEAQIEVYKNAKAEISSKLPSKDVFTETVKDVVEQIKSPDLSDNEKNLLLRTIIDHITFNKTDNRLDIFFYA